MEKIKAKYEVILGFVALIISLSAFKDELAKVSIPLIHTTISLADYYLSIVYCLSICLYLYIIENIAKDTKIGSWKIFDIILKIAYFLFVFTLITPILLALNFIIYKIYISLASDNKILNYANNLTSTIILGFLGGVISEILSKYILREKRIKLNEEIEEKEIKQLNNASKLYNDGYYSHSVLETFKTLETHLYKKLTQKDIRVPRHNINQIIQVALKNKIITENDLPIINDIRGMRNVAAHTDSNYTQQQAQFALDFVKKLISR